MYRRNLTPYHHGCAETVGVTTARINHLGDSLLSYLVIFGSCSVIRDIVVGMCPRDVALAMSPEIVCRFRRRLYRWESRKRYETEGVSKYVATKWCRCRPPLVVTKFSRILWKIAVADQWRTSSLLPGVLSQFLFRRSKLYPCRSIRPGAPRALSSFIDLVLCHLPSISSGPAKTPPGQTYFLSVL